MAETLRPHHSHQRAVALGGRRLELGAQRLDETHHRRGRPRAGEQLAYDLKLSFTTRHLAEWGAPARGDIVVFFSPVDGTRLVKRVIGLPGDTVELRHDILLINGVAQTYTLKDPAPYARDIFEDPRPIVAVESLGERDHLVLALPGRSALRSFAPCTVPAGSYFMMGDSRDNSNDSRFFGPVPRREIVGRASGVIVSFDTQRFLLPRFQRIAHPLAYDGT